MKRPYAPGRRARRLVVLLSLFAALGAVFASRVRAATPVTLDAANHAFAEGRYGEAATDFEHLVAEHGYSAPLLFDLGNAYLRDGKPVPAILAFERARLLAPRDEPIAANLAVARAAASAADDRSFLERRAHALSMNAWAWLAAGGAWLSLAGFGAAALWRRGRTVALSVATFTALTAVVSAAALGVASRDLHEGIVMDPAPVLVSPFASAQSDFSLAAGAHVQLGRCRDGYVFVRDGRGRSGWVERVQLEPLIPRAS